MDNILTIVAAAEWIILGIIVLRKVSYWNGVMQTLHDTLKKDEEGMKK